MDVGVTRMGLIRNPRSRRNQRSMPRAPGGLTEVRPDTQQALADALRTFQADGVELVVVDGGDGTVRDVLTALADAWRGPAPALALLPSGKTNVIAADVGVRGRRADALDRLGRAAAAGTLKRTLRRPLRVERPGSDQGALRGFVLGTAAYARATELALATSMRKGRGGGAVARTLAAAVLRATVGADRAAWLKGEPARVSVEGAAWPDGDRFLFLATSLDQLMLGVWPFWSHGAAPIKVLDVAAPPPRLLAALPAVLKGRPRRWMTDAGYRSAGAQAVDLTLPGGFILDGESYPPGAGGRVSLRADAPMTFVTP